MASRRLLYSLLSSTTSKFRLIPVRRNFMPWDCKVTPVDCTCQEGNTICCIPNNDGLDAGVESGWERVFHTRTERSGDRDPQDYLRRELKYAVKRESKQRESTAGLLIGCGKVEISVDGL